MIIVAPMAELPLQSFLKEHGVTLEVRQLGDGRWEATTSPILLWGRSQHTFSTEDPIRGNGTTSDEAAEKVCLLLSGHWVLLLDKRLDLRFTKVINALEPERTLLLTPIEVSDDRALGHGKPPGSVTHGRHPRARSLLG